MTNPQAVLVIAGPTASGKSAFALEEARRLGGVIVNADSMQIYDALPTLTARPSAAEQETADHRLYAVLPPEDNCSAWRWREMALAEIRNIQDEGRTPILVGGTGLYIKALTEGLSPMPEVPAAIRKETIDLHKGLGNPAFHKELARKDPETAARLHRNDTQRLIRAWEVLKATGKSISWWQDLPPVPPPKNLFFEVTVLMPTRAVLHERCNSRFDRMMASGVMEEVAALSARIDAGAIPEDAPIANALGFRPLRSYLRGEIVKEEAVEKAKAQTRQYAKRQVTWFRHQMPEARILQI